jgi:23S rRNA (guanosine2251-2'-O)-methyltransferase
MVKLNAKQLRVTKPTEEELAKIQRKQIWLFLDNVLDTYNIGSIFRLADAAAVAEVILCGGSETPPASRIHKAAVGTEEWVLWRYFSTAGEAIRQLRQEVPDIKIIAVEQNEKAVYLNQIEGVKEPFGLIVGHETSGVAQETMDLADQIVEIPMWGVNKSLNVHVSASIVLYKLIN